MSRMVESLVMDMTCELVEDMLPSSSPSDGKSQSSTSGDESLDFVDTDGNEWLSMIPTPDQVQEWGPWKHVKEEGDPHMMLGCWPPEDEMGLLPRVRSMTWGINVICVNSRLADSYIICSSPVLDPIQSTMERGYDQPPAGTTMLEYTK